MIKEILKFMSENEFIPHGFCLKWTPELLWSYVITDALIALAYYSIPVTLTYFVSQRKDLKFRWIYLMFSIFILACGTTHLMSMILIWRPFYWLDVGVKALTAVFSVATAIVLVRLIPEALRMPSHADLEQEINERKKSQMALQESENKLAIFSTQLISLIEAIPDAILLTDGAGCLLIVNESAKHLFKLHTIDWQGKTHQELAAIYPELSSMCEKCFTVDESAWAMCNLQVLGERVMDAEGIREFEVRKTPLFMNNEHKGLVVIVRDITESRLAERELRIAATAIDSQEGIVITDAKNRILRVNKAFTRLTGYSPAEVIGKTPAILKSNRHDHSFYQAMWEKLVRAKFWQGEIWDRRKNGEIYPKWLNITAVTDPNGQVTNYVGAFTDLSEHKDAEAAIHRLAFYDPLTDLPNRRLLLDRLALAMSTSFRSHYFGAVLLIDIDNFKIINDTKGHGVGDQLLIQVSQRLKACVRQGDTVARLGGDEFVIMLEDLHTEEDKAAIQAEGVGEKILDAFKLPYSLEMQEHHSSACIGIALFRGDELTSDEVIKYADTAMYQAKKSGRNILRFFDPDMQTALESRMILESEMHHALLGHQFKLFYQLQIDNTGRVIGAEVLLRWIHPNHGVISPLQFIPIAEETGLIVPIGEWVLRTACLQLVRWENKALFKGLHLAVNVSPRQFSQPDFVKELHKLLEQTGANAELLKLELTETLIMENLNEAIKKMEGLKSIGIRFSMDDFGTGYSSLSYLKKLPLSQLKIDQSFVKDITTNQSDAIITQTIIGMGNNLGLNVIAEGVETEAQRACLESQGCLAYQGYLFSKPVPLEEFEVLLVSHHHALKQVS